MNPAIEISLCVLAWLIALNRGRTALVNRAWKNDPTAFLVGSASLFFALTMTFLVTPLSDVVNRLTLPNFSRLLAYSFGIRDALPNDIIFSDHFPNSTKPAPSEISQALSSGNPGIAARFVRLFRFPYP